MRKNFIVIGLGSFGTSIATALCELGHEVLAIDSNAVRVDSIKDHVTHAIQSSTVDEHSLSQFGISNFDCVIVGMGDDLRASVLTTIICKELGAKYIVAKASDALHARLLKKTGADKTIQPEYEAGKRLARSLVSGDLIDYLELSDEYSVNETRIPSAWIGHSLLDLNVRNNYGVSVIAIRRGSDILITLDPHAPLQEDDVLILIGANGPLDRITKMKS